MIAVLTYKVLHDTAPRYLGPLDRVADLHGRRALRSASSSHLVVPMFRLSTVGSRTFNVSGPWIWNGLPKDVVSALTFSSFWHRLKLFLFQQLSPLSNAIFRQIIHFKDHYKSKEGQQSSSILAASTCSIVQHRSHILILSSNCTFNTIVVLVVMFII